MLIDATLQVSGLHNCILESHGHLSDAAIPVQDLHLTLFVATLHEEDGTLQVSAKTRAVISAEDMLFR